MLATLVGAALLVAFYVSASDARDQGAANGMAKGFELASRTHKNVDPLRPPGLPAGVAIDPKTGYLVGLDLKTRPGEKFLSWSRLKASDYPNGIDDVPEDVRALDGKSVSMVGFVMALFEPVQFREFVLVGSTFTCCYGTPPGLGGIVKATLRSDVAALDMDPRPIIVRGTFVIKEMRLDERPDSPVVLLYRLENGESQSLE